MKKSFWSIPITATLLLGSISGYAGTVKAESIDSLQSKINDIQNEREQIKGDITIKDTKINEMISSQNEVTAQIKLLDEKIQAATTEIAAVSTDIEKTNAEIEKLRKEIEELKKKIEERTALLEDRARAIQLSGGNVSYIDVLLGAESFSNFIDRFSAVNTLVEADHEIMEEQQRDKDSLEKKEKEVQENLQKLEQKKAELDRLKAELDRQKNEKDNLMAELEAKQSELVGERTELEEKDKELLELSSDVEQEILSEQSRLAELARQREEEMAAAATREVSVSSSNASVPASSSGSWTSPASGVITTEFGYDVLNGKERYHYGMDIAASVGTPVRAAGSGYVTSAKVSNSYGNWIILTHSVNGQTFSTVYAHLSSMSVSQGQYVEKGQVIGGMGNTGYSFGTHLHFEVHEGEWNAAKSNAINPRKYVSF
ncbi:murein hydrolase activator EnvC family protein [Jeotgalibacillus soli]|uniref:Uncharacterized protein n=1 Tax=Jeotgalibacillus soli TaxID=889306 RepID=A0A0C2V8E3_9BACL|nr:peptidoglycan DD-metalloendopeptidase family protein [Jeotgalibacillus soli]KIL45227.1 hypothetical protein KP78_27710 [Jeotgalibacillus soli]